jgi:UDP-N-acetylglucosamine 3-dehydrogenase
MPLDKVKVGIVGLGLVSTSHLKGYASHPHAEVVAVCDIDEERAHRFAVAHGIPEVYSSYEDMLGADIDAVDIATPTYLHASMVIQAADHGKHVHCEKPFCRSVGEGLAACEAARRNGCKLVVGETYAFITSHVKARELIDAGEIGRPLQIRERHGDWIERKRTSSDVAPPDRSWRVDPEKSGGGAYPWIYDHAVHFFATAEYLMPGQTVAEVYALTATSRHAAKRSGAAHDPYVTAETDIPIITWKYEDSDRQGVWTRAERLNGKYDYMRGFSTTIVGERGLIEVLGEGGHNLLWDGRQQHLVLHRAGKAPVCLRFDEGGDDIWASDICYYSQGHVNQVHHLIDCILYDREPRYSGEDGVHAVRCTLATIRSAQTGRPVRIEEIDPDYTAYAVS